MTRALPDMTRSAILIVLAGWLAAPAVAAATLEQDMTAEEFEATGLVRLTPDELARLNAWLGRNPASPAVVFGAEQLERPEPAVPVERIEARIAGEFDGWDGHTYFTLDNGQVWQQRVSGIYRRHATSPEVTIEKGRFGYYLSLKGDDRRVGVKRVR